MTGTRKQGSYQKIHWFIKIKCTTIPIQHKLKNQQERSIILVTTCPFTMLNYPCIRMNPQLKMTKRRFMKASIRFHNNMMDPIFMWGTISFPYSIGIKNNWKVVQIILHFKHELPFWKTNIFINKQLFE